MEEGGVSNFFWRVIHVFGKGKYLSFMEDSIQNFSPKSRLSRALCCLPNVPNAFPFRFFFAVSQNSVEERSETSASVSFLRHLADRVFVVFLLFFMSSDFSAADTLAMSGQVLSEGNLLSMNIYISVR